MQEQSKSVYKTLTWLLLLVVIGLYAMHLWYSGTLKENLAAQRISITEGAQQLQGAKTKLDLAVQTERGLRGEIDRVQADRRRDIQDLTRQMESANQTNEALKADITALQRQHAETLAAEKGKAADALAAEQRKAADAYAELQGRFDMATQTVAAMGADILRLKQAQEDAAASHTAELTALEQQHKVKVQDVQGQFKERLAALQTTLEGTDPERAELFASFDQRIESGLTTIAGLETTNGELTDRLTAATETIEQRTQALTDANTQLQNAQADLTQTRGELSQLESQYDAAMDKATLDLAAVQAKHDAAVENAAAQQADLKAQHAAALDQAAQQQADLKAQHAVALEQAAKQQADLKTQHAAALDQAAKEQADLQAQHKAALEAAAKKRADLEAAHAAALDQAARDAAALKTSLESELARAKASHSEEIGQAKGRIETLAASLASETAALAALQTKHDNLVADLKSKLADTEQALSGVRSDLSAAQEAAAQQKAALEQQLATAEGRVATVEETLSTEHKQAEAALAAAKQAHADAMARQHDLLVQVSALGGKETERGLLLTLAEADLTFPVSKATLPAGDLPSLDHIAALLTQFPRLTARIEGHTDASGRDETNLALSQERADAVKHALVERGIAGERMEAIGVGETRPIADNATRAGSRQNRRVEIYVVEATR